MAERGGMLFGEGPTACPFVALESDRDRRVDEPDHRHRCYAEPEPAPRAIAHQRAYCLAAAFPSCPIFQDWAVRAAARPVPLRPGAALPDDDEPPPMPDWAAPPPWAAEAPDPDQPQQLGAFDSAGASGTGVGGDADVEPAGWSAPARPLPPETVLERPTVARDAPPEQIERLPSLPVDRTGNAERDAQLEAQRQQRMLDERQRRQEDERRRRADEERRERERQAAAAAAVPPFLAARVDPAVAPAQATPPSRPQGPPLRPAGQPAAPHAADVAASRQAAAGRPLPMAAAGQRQDLLPVWEREPIQAYPSLRRRIGIGGGGDTISTLTTLLAVLAAIALVVFVIIALPSFLGGGGAPGRTSAAGAIVSPSPASETVVPPSPSPTEVPAETPRTYVVQAGDSLFAIAARFGLSVDQLLAANPQITNADYVTIGQVIIIPDRDFATPTAAPS